MAKKTLTVDTLTLNEWSDLTLQASVTDGDLIPCGVADNKRLIIAQNTAEASGTLTVKKGNGYAASNDLATFTLGAGEVAAIRLDDSRFKNVSGTDKGHILITPSATSIKVAVVELP